MTLCSGAGMEPEAFVEMEWGYTATESRPNFAFWCSAAPVLSDTHQAVALRGAAHKLPERQTPACTFLASFDGEWERMVAVPDAAAFRPTRPLDPGEHTLRVRAVDAGGVVAALPPPHPAPHLQPTPCSWAPAAATQAGRWH